MVEAAGQLVPVLSNRPGLYLHPVYSQDAGRVIRGVDPANPSAGSVLFELSRSMSLYRAGLRLALFLPLGVAMPSCDGAGSTDVSPVFTLPLRVEATIALIEPASASPPPSALHA